VSDGGTDGAPVAWPVMQEAPAPAAEGKQPSADAYRAPVGTHDVLPPESGRWAALVGAFAGRATRFGYGLVMTPAYEHVEVFQRVGEGTDVVRKEMYEFEDKRGRRLALRPEGTAPVVRAYIQHRPTPPWKVWYLSPHFRHEKAQRGRYRQHHQLGVEVIGVDDPALDVEVISLAQGFLSSLGLSRFRLAINSLGDGQCRPGYLEALRAYLRAHESELCDDSRARYETNPLRVLDCKVPSCVAVTERAPQLLEHLCADCKTHFEAVQAGLDAFVVDAVGPEAGADVIALLAELRETGLSADRAYGGRSVRAQTKAADRAGARYVVLVGRTEMEKGAVAVRDMESGEQLEVP